MFVPLRSGEQKQKNRQQKFETPKFDDYTNLCRKSCRSVLTRAVLLGLIFQMLLLLFLMLKMSVLVL